MYITYVRLLSISPCVCISFELIGAAEFDLHDLSCVPRQPGYCVYAWSYNVDLQNAPMKKISKLFLHLQFTTV